MDYSSSLEDLAEQRYKTFIGHLRCYRLSGFEPLHGDLQPRDSTAAKLAYSRS